MNLRQAGHAGNKDRDGEWLSHRVCCHSLCNFLPRFDSFRKQVAIDAGVKQTERAIFIHGIKIVTSFKCISEETMPK